VPRPLLLIDPDQVARDPRAADLRAAGFEVTAVPDLAGRPDGGAPAAIVLVDRGQTSALTSLATLRGQGAPVLVVVEGSPPERRAALLQSGAARVLDAGANLASELGGWLTTNAPSAPSPSATSFSGVLSAQALASLVEALGDASSVITCTSLADEHGTIWLREGRIIDAQLGWLPPVRALGRLFTWEGGRYVAHIAPHQHEEALALDAQGAAREAQRRAEVWHQLVTGLGGLDSVYSVDFVALARQLGEVADEANTLLRLIDGQRTLRVLVDAIAVDELQTLALALRLRLDGVLKPASSVVASGVVPPPVVQIPALVPGEGPPAVVPAEAPSERIVEAIDQALSFASTPSIVQWTPAEGSIPVVRFAGRRGTRREALEQSALDARLEAAQRHQQPLLLVDEVLAPGANAAAGEGGGDQITEVLVSAARSPVRDDSTSLRIWAALVVTLLVVVSVMLVLFATLNRVPAMESDNVAKAPPSAAPAPAATRISPRDSRTLTDTAGVPGAARPIGNEAVDASEHSAQQAGTAGAYVDLGREYDKAAMVDRAIAAFQRATRIEPESATAYLYLGSALREAHRLTEARAAYQRFLDLEPPGSARRSEVESMLAHL
jgi:tetratricopeptide (TPR) repeat protein